MVSRGKDNGTAPGTASGTVTTTDMSQLVTFTPGTAIAVQYGGSLRGWTSAVHDGDNIIITPTAIRSGTPSVFG